MKPLAMLLALGSGLVAMPGWAQTPAAGEGTTIVGERETAVGLYLLPWQEEAPSDIDRPPARYAPDAAPLDAEQLRAATASDEANAAYRRVRTEPR